MRILSGLVVAALLGLLPLELATVLLAAGAVVIAVYSLVRVERVSHEMAHAASQQQQATLDLRERTVALEQSIRRPGV